MWAGFCLAPQFGQTARSFPFFFAAAGAAVLAIRFAIRRPGLQPVQGTPSIMPAVHLHLATSGSAVFIAGDAFGFFFSGLGTPRSFARRAMSRAAAFTSPWPERCRMAAFSRSPAVSIG